jgi:hypothetical protein
MWFGLQYCRIATVSTQSNENLHVWCGVVVVVV